MVNTHIIQLLFIIFISWFFGRTFRKRLDLPPMLGELLAGLIFGPPVLDLIHPSEYLEFLSELGIFFLMFYAGTETDPKIFFKSIKESLFAGIFGFIIPFALGVFGTRYLMPDSTVSQALFIGVGLSITAIAVNVRILMDLGMQGTRIANILIGAALVDDILALGVFSSIIDMVKTGSFTLGTVASSMLHVIVFFLISYKIGRVIIPTLNKYYLEDGHGFTFSLLTALVFAVLAELMGLHEVIGAFLAGLFVREELKSSETIDRLNDRLMIISYGFLGPVFFVSLAFHVNLGEILSNIWFITAVIAIAFGGKYIGSYMGCRLAGTSHEEGVLVGAGMNGRGAVELIIVSVGVSLGILTQQIVTVLVSMAFITTFLTPFAFKLLFRHYGIKGRNQL